MGATTLFCIATSKKTANSSFPSFIKILILKDLKRNSCRGIPALTSAMRVGMCHARPGKTLEFSKSSYFLVQLANNEAIFALSKQSPLTSHSVCESVQFVPFCSEQKTRLHSFPLPADFFSMSPPPPPLPSRVREGGMPRGSRGKMRKQPSSPSFAALGFSQLTGYGGESHRLTFTDFLNLPCFYFKKGKKYAFEIFVR